jgi:hypothetical protein
MNEASKVIYKIGATSNYGKPWAWCEGLHWVEGKMDYLAPSQLTDRFKESCRLNNNLKPGLHIDDVGTEWPDWLGSGGGMPHFFVSERV